MGILDDDIARVRDATDVVALIGERIALRRVGRRFVGLCPFHGEKTPSFSVNGELGVYYCFGCQASGDAITFVRALDGLDFAEAVERLASRAGITLRYDDAAVSRDRQRRTRLTEAAAAAVAFYQRALLEAPDARPARDYLRSRGFDGAAARRFSLGWSGDAFDALSRHLTGLRFSRDDQVSTGLAFVNRTQKLQDVFRARLMFPIYERSGDPVGFGARTLTGDGPKYKNTAETPLYHKSRLLYGLNWAKAEIGARGEVVVCEGYTDVMAFALAGVPQAVATCGTALADEHVQILKNFTRRILLAYDADSAGRSAAEKWSQWEHRFDVEVRVVALANGEDPADAYRRDSAALAAAVKSAKRFMQFKIDRVLDDADLMSPEGRVRAAEELVPVLAEHPNELVREQYIQTVAGTLGIDHAWFKDALARGAPARPRPPTTGGPVLTTPLRIDPREYDALRWAFHAPDQVVDWIDAALFADPVVRDAFDALADAPDERSALARAEGDARRLLERVAVDILDLDDEPETASARLVINVVEPAAQRVLTALLRNGDERVSAVKALLDRMVTARANGDWIAGEDAARHLVRWVAEWPPDRSAPRVAPSAPISGDV